ncbi:MAG TPA: hypothetical protein PLO78_00625 [Candidatus Omnitrophota bacterium]|nr:hypothetical protein [Candidatus Omnitrophota bacterium]
MESKNFKGTIPQQGMSPLFFAIILPFLFLSLAGCSPVSYPQNQVQQAIQEITCKEYRICDVKVEFAGTTLGVFLPLDHLFAMDFKDAIMSGKVTNMENLFQPTEAAVNKVEDVLLSMSRVMLSTDKKIHLYYLQATDIEKTGMDLTFTGHIEDVKRVRFWDIPRSEYRKRVVHDIRLNRAALWHRPVRYFFRDLNVANRQDIQTRYFPNTAEAKWTPEFFFANPGGEVLQTGRAAWHILDLKSISIQDNEIVVYAKVRAVSKNLKVPEFPAQILEYLFQVEAKGDEEKIRRIIPMAYLDSMLDFSFTREMVYESLPNWDTDFKTPDLTVGDFLALQLTRRMQIMASEDERLFNTFTNIKLVFRYEQKPEPYFSFNALASLKGMNQVPYSDQKGIHEDILYLWDLVAREFAGVVRSYNYQNYKYLQFQLAQLEEDLLLWNIRKDDLELFRRRQKSLKDILKLEKEVSSPTAKVP